MRRGGVAWHGLRRIPGPLRTSPCEALSKPCRLAIRTPKALACSGLLVQERTPQGVSQGHVWLRFLAARPVSGATMAFLS
jgi:hypothetical protein